jgi:hypothetical protein
MAAGWLLHAILQNCDLSFSVFRSIKSLIQDCMPAAWLLLPDIVCLWPAPLPPAPTANLYACILV